MKRMKRGPWGYVVALVAVLLALGSLFIPHFGKGFGNLLFLAVLVSVWYGGLGPGLFATGLTSAIALTLVLMNNHGTVPPAEVVGLVSFTIGGVVITELVEALHAALRQVESSKGWLSAVLTSIGDAVIATDELGRVTFANPIARSLTGWEEGDAVGMSLGDVFQIVSEDNRQPVESPVTRVLREGTVVGLGNHTILIGRDGAERPIDDSAAPIKDDQGTVSGVVLVFRDVTERRRAEQAAEEANRRIIEILDSIADAAFAVDFEGRYTYVNPRWESYYGLRAADVVGRVMWDLFPEVLGTSVEDHYRYVLEQGAPAVFETISPIKGSWIEVRAFRSSNWVFSYIHDISERKLAENALRQSDRRKDEFLAMLAHELRNPLAAISNATHVFRHFHGPEPVEWGKDVIERQVGHLSRLMDDLLDVSRITQGKIQLRRQLIDAKSIVGGAVETARPLIDERQHRLSVNVPAEPLWIDGDPTRLEQMIQNLLSNAAKYTDKGGEITLAATAENGAIVFRIRDTGVGIPPELQDQIFDLFVQGDRTLARSEGGLGIGLTLVKTLAEMHGGSIAATSDGAGKGSEFILCLPSASPPPETESVRPASMAAKNASLKILIVDDHVDTVKGLARLLKFSGHEVEVAHDGPSALDRAESVQPDVILLDIGLPGMDGYEVVKRLRQVNHVNKALLIAISGYGQEDDRKRSVAAGFDHHLVKPVDPDALLGLIQN